jgi:23S rRNA pseudouridine1911/1915/1917 synthase
MSKAQGHSARPSVTVLYEDDYCVVFDKPAKRLVIPAPDKKERTLVDMVNEQFAATDDRYRLHPCHRLDRDTSGVILFAKGKKNQQILMELFQKHSIQKKYIVFAQGRLKKSKGTIRSNIRDLEQKKFHKRAEAKFAITQYKVLKITKHFTVVEAVPVTGRTNQIRIHFTQLGHPLVGERKYAFGRDATIKFNRAALHASVLEWAQPDSGKRVRVEAPLPEDLERLLVKG